MVCYGRDVDNMPSNAIKIANEFEVKSHAALTRLTGQTGIFSPFATRNCIRYLEYFKPDVVHLHELHGYYVNIVTLVEYLKKNEIPTVWTFHCEFMYTGKCGYAYECERWKVNCGHCPQLSEYPKSLFFDKTKSMFLQKKNLFSGFDYLKIITPSKWLAGRVKQSFLIEKDIEVIYNGIDTNLFQPRNASELRSQLGINSKHIVVSIAPDILSDRKGGRWILDLASRMREEDLTFVLVGVEGHELSMPDNVLAIPRVNDKILLSKYYSLGSFFMLCSKKETFSLVCAESLACGTPIIGFDAGAPAEVASDGYGKFVEYGNLDLLQSALMYALNNRESFKASQICAQYAKDKFSKDVMINNYISSYRDVIDKYKKVNSVK